ncbi:MAG: glycosyltransferase family 2 protein [Prevotellaceae bacterium]|nr:glycosyltransferase family 2 protein [Prevotellaceae bacterium]
MRKLAIVILNWNGAEMLRRYLPTVLANSAVGDVIVADNASTDGSVDMLLREFPQVQVIVLEQNFGFAKGYDRALDELPDYEYYMLLNSDVEIRQKDWDVPLVRYMDEHSECAACQPKLLSLREAEIFEYAGAAGGFLDRYGYPFCRGRVMNTVEKDEGQYDEVVPLLWATGAALLVRASDWRESGGLDARFFAHMEEIDLCWRLRTMGRTIVCVSDSTAYHLGGATLSHGNPHKTFLNFRNNLLMLYKNLPQDELLKVMRVRRFLDYVAAFQFLLKGDVSNFMAVVKARSTFRRICRDFEADRQRIQQMRSLPHVPERTRFLLLWRYYAKGEKTFAELMK